VPTLLAAVLVVLVGAWHAGAFESRLAYWRDRGQDCGTVRYGLSGALDDSTGAEQAAACFASAHARCKPATLTREVSGFDFTDIDVFVTEAGSAGGSAGGGCDVGLHHEFILANTTTREVQCAAATRDGTLLTFSGCGDLGDFIVPKAHL
jgi:hypothetical protein